MDIPYSHMNVDLCYGYHRYYVQEGIVEIIFPPLDIQRGTPRPMAVSRGKDTAKGLKHRIIYDLPELDCIRQSNQFLLRKYFSSERPRPIFLLIYLRPNLSWALYYYGYLTSVMITCKFG